MSRSVSPECLSSFQLCLHSEGCQGPWVCLSHRYFLLCFPGRLTALELGICPFDLFRTRFPVNEGKGQGSFLLCLPSCSVVCVDAFFLSSGCFAACQASCPASAHCSVTCPSLCHCLLVLSTVVEKMHFFEASMIYPSFLCFHSTFRTQS